MPLRTQQLSFNITDSMYSMYLPSSNSVAHHKDRCSIAQGSFERGENSQVVKGHPLSFSMSYLGRVEAVTK